MKSLRGAGYTVSDPHYKRVPAGYTADHPRADLLRHNTLYARAPQIDPAVLPTAKLVDACFEHSRVMLPLHEWLVNVYQRVAV